MYSTNLIGSTFSLESNVNFSNDINVFNSSYANNYESYQSHEMLPSKEVENNDHMEVEVNTDSVLFITKDEENCSMENIRIPTEKETVELKENGTMDSNNWSNVKLKYRCIYVECDFRVGNIRDLHSHIMNNHPEGSFDIKELSRDPVDRPYICITCDKSFKKQYDIKRHLLTHSSEKPYSCSSCDKQFREKIDLKRHTMMHTGERPHECDKCDKKFIRKTHLTRHLLTHEKKMEYIYTEGMEFACIRCGKGFRHKSQLKRHEAVHNGDKPFECHICNKRIKYKRDLKRHMLTHLGIKEHKCNICNKRFSRASHLKRHFNTHKDKGLFQCGVCNESFDAKEAIADHITRQHGVSQSCNESFDTKVGCMENFVIQAYNEAVENKPSTIQQVTNESFHLVFDTPVESATDFVVEEHGSNGKELSFHSCGNCNEKFETLILLKEHEKNHNIKVRRSYTCHLCGKIFTDSSSLKNHIRVHTGEKPYLCTTCGKVFRKSSHLNGHMRVHSGERPYQCTICGDRYTHPGNLKRHVRLHTNEKPFTCTICPKKFSRQDDLKRHILTHNDERLFKCDICLQPFKNERYLKRHSKLQCGQKKFTTLNGLAQY